MNITGYRVTIEDVVKAFVSGMVMKDADGNEKKVDPKEYRYLIDPVQGIISLDLKVED